MRQFQIYHHRINEFLKTTITTESLFNLCGVSLLHHRLWLDVRSPLNHIENISLKTSMRVIHMWPNVWPNTFDQTTFSVVFYCHCAHVWSKRVWSNVWANVWWKLANCRRALVLECRVWPLIIVRLAGMNTGQSDDQLGTTLDTFLSKAWLLVT